MAGLDLDSSNDDVPPWVDSRERRDGVAHRPSGLSGSLPFVSSVALRRAVDALPGKDPVVQRPEDGFCQRFASDRGRQVLAPAGANPGAVAPFGTKGSDPDSPLAQTAPAPIANPPDPSGMPIRTITFPASGREALDDVLDDAVATTPIAEASAATLARTARLTAPISHLARLVSITRNPPGRRVAEVVRIRPQAAGITAAAGRSGCTASARSSRRRSPSPRRSRRSRR
jgi:hypothetical protein